MRASASSCPAGSGCSTSVTPASAQAARFCSRLSGVQASLASTISSDSGAALRTAAIRSPSPSPPSLILSSGRCAALAVAAAIASGVPSEIVKAVVQGRGAGRPSRVQTRWPRLLASRSSSAQSSALRAAPAGIAACRACRSSPPRQRFLHRLEGGQRRFRGLAIAGIGHAFAAPGMAAMADLGHDGDGLGLGAPADREGTRDRPAFDAGGKLSGYGWKSF